MPNIWIGIDPGASGATVVLNEAGEHLESYCFQEWRVVGEMLSTYRETALVALEQVGSMPGQGVTSMFSFGQNYGGYIALLEYLQVPYVLVRPQKWQKAILGSFPKGEGKTRAASYIRRRFPVLELTKNAKKNEGIIDALCIALYIRENH